MYQRLIFLSLILTTGACLADIRPEELRTTISAESARQGRELLQRAAETHGAARWTKGQVVRVRLTDTWPEGLQTKLISPWPAAVQRLELEFVVGTDNSRARLLDGPAQGQTWGIQQWATYKTINGRREFIEDDDIKFWLPTIQYFIELPFRITDANVTAYAGEETIDGQAYELALASWNTLDPQSDTDQYLLFINKSTGALDFTRFTVRDVAPFAAGVMQYSDLRPAAGVRLAHRLRAIDDLDDRENYLHEMTIESITVADDLDPAELLPEPGRSGSK